jgi:predicted PhzF superfamily epimerase YddE/YHI9
MNIDVYIVDAFAERGLRGNPAGVCPLQQWLDDAMMLAIAAEINQSETAFFVPEGDDFRIRWFTPTREVDHIGHATLAAGWLVIDKLEPTRGRVRFLTTGGYMLVRHVGTSAALDMPALPPRPTSVTEAAVQALGRRPREAFAAKHYLFVFDDPAEIATLHPNMIALAELDLPGVIVTAAGGEGSDFVSRFFAPANGVPEDPVSGVSHCCLAPFWTERLKRTRLVGRQLSKRGGVVLCECEGERVVLSGGAVITLEGRLRLPL